MKEHLKKDIFGNEISKKDSLREQFGANPFTVFDTKEQHWRERKQWWNNKGILPPLEPMESKSMVNMPDDKFIKAASTFDPVLCELMYRWYCPEGGAILDPFAGGSVRGIVAGYLGYKYTGIDIRPEQVASNIDQASRILGASKQPEWLTGSSNVLLFDQFLADRRFDMMLTCPPYFNLEVYSDIEGDLSNMDWPSFVGTYRSIIRKACALLKKDAMAVIVVGEIRARNGYLYGLVPATIKAFEDCGMKYYNEAVLETPVVSAQKRASSTMRHGKLVKVHQNVLMFKKPY
jgi:DNA modification methylase